MMNPVRVLYSFPHRLGAQRICNTAWQQVEGVENAGAHLTVCCGSLARPVSIQGPLITTLAKGRLRIPTRWIGRENSLAWHDRMTARWLEKNHSQIDLVHVWPGAALHTMGVAKKHGIVCVLERPNTHTGYAFEAAAEEARRCGIDLPKGHDHAFDQNRLDQELVEYADCDFLLCPSDFVVRTFIERGVQEEKLLRHRYGYDGTLFYPGEDGLTTLGAPRLTVLYAGVCEPRKGLHLLLEAWFQSGAHQDCKLSICGEFVPGYEECLRDRLTHPSIEVLGHRNDLPDLMRKADLFVLSSVEEGSALVTYEAMACGCVLLVSDATGAPCVHRQNGLVHQCRNTNHLARHLEELRRDSRLRRILRANSVVAAENLTWRCAGSKLLEVYRQSLQKSARSAINNRVG